MSGLFEIYLKHNLSKEQIMIIDKILTDNSFNYLRSFNDYYKRSLDNRNLKQIKDIGNIQINTYRFSLKEEELNLPIFNKYDLKSREWIKDVLCFNKAIEVSAKYFSLILGKEMLQINIMFNLDVFIFKKEIHSFQLIRKFIFDIAKIVNINYDFKAFYVFNESEYFNSKYFDIYFDDLFYSIPYNKLYELLLTFKHKKISNISDIEKLIKKDEYSDILIDDFRDFKQLENT